MAITDNIIGRLQRAAGDAAPVNTVTGTPFTGGTITGIDQGGELAWRFQGPGVSISAIPDVAVTSVNLKQVTLAVRVIVTANGSAFDYIAGAGYDPSIGGLFISNSGANDSRARWISQGTITTEKDPRSEVFTYVLKLNNVSGTDTVQIWLQDGGPGDGYDRSSAAFNLIDNTLDRLYIGNDTQAAYDITMLDFVVWDRGLTDAEARSVATNLRAELPVAGAPTGPTINTQPTSQAVVDGQAVTFTSAATTSGGAMTSQWYEYPSTLLTGETGDSLTFTPAVSDSGKSYFNRYTDDNGFTDTNAADLTVTQYTVDVTLQMVNEDGSPATNLTGLGWAFFDQTNPNALLAPVEKGTGETTDGSGTLSITVENSTLTSGQTGYLIVSDTDGTVSQNPAQKAFAGPVAVA